MDHKCLVSSRHGDTLNKERWDTPDHPQGVLPQNWCGTEQNRTVPCMVIKVKANGRSSIGDESPMCLPCVETGVTGKEGPGN
ncbi:hypothetical protein TNCV_4255561 [Trichonephila clavipes]|nr:hypothetical protein TNCV_4255561 [Trichonephila clavipes]